MSEFCFCFLLVSVDVAQIRGGSAARACEGTSGREEITGEGVELRAALQGHARPQWHHGSRDLALSDTFQ